ncbi:MAG: winged helix-turn-helix domain-containing protein [Corynebacterium sp.]|nr:winged helix-turn-helix domain-containing protein [Corynebacterium sp.]
MSAQQSNEEQLAARIAALEERVATLEQSLPPAQTPNQSELNGTIHFAGEVTLPVGDAAYQWTRPVEILTDTLWNTSTERISALAHPVRTRILRHLLEQHASVADLVEAKIVSSPGTAYHHITALQTAGWLEKYNSVLRIPAARIIPLLCLIACGEDH